MVFEETNARHRPLDEPVSDFEPNRFPRIHVRRTREDKDYPTSIMTVAQREGTPPVDCLPTPSPKRCLSLLHCRFFFPTPILMALLGSVVQAYQHEFELRVQDHGSQF